MPDATPIDRFTAALRIAVTGRQLAKITLSKPARKSATTPKNLYGKLVDIKGNVVVQINHRYQDREEVKNFTPDKGIDALTDALGTIYLNGDLFTPDEHLSIQISRKGNARINSNRSARASDQEASAATVRAHDRIKQRDITSDRPYLRDLGITNKDGIVLPAGKRKFKQINKFVEILDGLVNSHPLPDNARIVDMGSGSGYLTFALYDHLVNTLGLKISMIGVELRPGLVKKCNEIATRHGMGGLHFVEGSIDNYRAANIDVLIALHACDTATDDAL